MMVKIDIKGTQFGVKPPGIPMPKTIKLQKDGFKCPKAARKGSQMYACCVRDKKSKNKKLPPTKFLPRRYGDLTIDYDVLQAYGNNYLAQVTIDNNHPLGRPDNWNLTWEWKRGPCCTPQREGKVPSAAVQASFPIGEEGRPNRASGPGSDRARAWVF